MRGGARGGGRFRQEEEWRRRWENCGGKREEEGSTQHNIGATQRKKGKKWNPLLLPLEEKANLPIASKEEGKAGNTFFFLLPLTP